MYATHMTQQSIIIKKRIQKIKEELAKLGDMRPGSLSEQTQVRNNKPYIYWQISYTHLMKSRTEYVRPELVKKTATQIATFKKFKALTAEWVDLAIQLAKLEIAGLPKK
jgi:hypothetical protein